MPSRSWGRGLDLTNKKYGMLIVKAERGRDERQNVVWECLCECGGKSYVTTGNLRSGNSRSCGCQQVSALKASPQRERSRMHLQSRLDALTYPADITHIEETLFPGERERAAKWASENAKTGHLRRVKRGIYDRP
jgi:hypothetical protein